MDYQIYIKFTWTISDEKVECLDVSIYLEGQNIKTSIFYKPTNTHSYLSYDSHHPLACRNSIPFSQFLRLKRICSDNQGKLKR